LGSTRNDEGPAVATLILLLLITKASRGSCAAAVVLLVIYGTLLGIAGSIIYAAYSYGGLGAALLYTGLVVGCLLVLTLLRWLTKD
jgi:FtsH-binding integral membrane protein